MEHSPEEYRAILQSAKARGAVFSPMVEAGRAAHPGAKRVYLRHDVDFSLEMAVRLAEVNAAEGVQGTFFVLLRSPVYNLLSYDSLGTLHRLLGLGQRLGLHVAVPDPLPANDSALADLVQADFAVAQRHIGALDPVYAWHNTSPELLDRGLTLETEGLASAYSQSLFRQIPYRSDTGMQRTRDEWHELMREDHDAIQVLFHPELWIGGGSSPTTALARTWPLVIREREVEFRRNKFYRRDFPDGLPAAALDALAAELQRTARRCHADPA
jgi:hypothetical protein